LQVDQEFGSLEKGVLECAADSGRLSDPKRDSHW